MSEKMKMIKHKLGILYWDIRKKCNEIIYKSRKRVKSLNVFILGFLVKKQIDYNKINKVKCLIICAHPDDETIFFYSIIKKFKPYIICMSNRGNKTRRKEFENALKHQGVDGVLLNFPDMIGFRWRWLEPLLISKLKNIKKNAHNLEGVYTHNNVGESGHHHHFDLSCAARKVFKDKQIYLTSEYANEKDEVKDYADKEYIVKSIYKSQYKMLSMWCPWFKHYMKYEYFEKVKRDNDKHSSTDI